MENSNHGPIIKIVLKYFGGQKSHLPYLILLDRVCVISKI